MHRIKIIAALTVISAVGLATAQARHKTYVSAEALLAQGKYEQATSAYKKRANLLSGTVAGLRYAAIAEILENHPTGIYNLQTSYPSGASLLSPSSQYLAPGEVELKHPLAMRAALRDLAADKVRSARKIMKSAELMVEEHHEKAETELDIVRRLLNQANIFSYGIASSYFPNVAEIQINIHRKRSTILAQEFDDSLNLLDEIEPGTEHYYEQIEMLLEKVDDISEELHYVIDISKRYPTRFETITGITQTDLKMLEKIRKSLLSDMQKVNNV